jgi:hypothetical protein
VRRARAGEAFRQKAGIVGEGGVTEGVVTRDEEGESAAENVAGGVEGDGGRDEETEGRLEGGEGSDRPAGARPDDKEVRPRNDGAGEGGKTRDNMFVMLTDAGRQR